jgi:hypothetical protein
MNATVDKLQTHTESAIPISNLKSQISNGMSWGESDFIPIAQ